MQSFQDESGRGYECGRGDTNLARERWGRGGGGHHPFQDERGTQT